MCAITTTFFYHVDKNCIFKTVEYDVTVVSLFGNKINIAHINLYILHLFPVTHFISHLLRGHQLMTRLKMYQVIRLTDWIENKPCTDAGN